MKFLIILNLSCLIGIIEAISVSVVEFLPESVELSCIYLDNRTTTSHEQSIQWTLKGNNYLSLRQSEVILICEGVNKCFEQVNKSSSESRLFVSLNEDICIRQFEGKYPLQGVCSVLNSRTGKVEAFQSFSVHLPALISKEEEEEKWWNMTRETKKSLGFIVGMVSVHSLSCT